MKHRLTGLIAAPFTAMDAGGGLNIGMIESQAELLLGNHVNGAFICGTTGEGLSLTTQERIRVAERWIEVAPSDFKVIVHVGAGSIEDSRNLAMHAQKIGAHAFATIGPSFFRPEKTAQLVDFCARVAAAAPSLPFYYYHIPALTGVDLPMLEFLQLAGDRIPNLAGIKFTDEDLMSYSQCLSFEGARFDILFGRDEILLSALALGATGAVGSTYNYMAPIYQKLMAAFQAGDLRTAQKYQTAAMNIIAVMNGHGGLAAGKAMMRLVGVDCGPVRPPLQNLPPKAMEAFVNELKTVGFPDMFRKTNQQQRNMMTETASHDGFAL